jgi:pyruvate kinase
MRRAKIVATLGPASSTPELLRSLLEAGVDVARLNFSHGDAESHAAALKALRQAADELQRPVTALQDLQGPKLRTGPVSGNLVVLRAGAEVELLGDPGECSERQLHVLYPKLAEDLHPGDPVLVSDGRIRLRVQAVRKDSVRAVVEAGGELRGEAGVHFPGVRLSAEALTPKDLQDLNLGLELGVDALAMSFVRSAQDIQSLRAALRERSPAPLPIIAKLEQAEALENLEGILAAADGVMVARGDLGVEVSPEAVPSLQKRILQRATAHSAVSITATEMLESMIHQPRPTRAEASDVANAVFDGSDALMLSGETAIGEYPAEAVATMARIIQDAEAHAAEWGARPAPEWGAGPTGGGGVRLGEPGAEPLDDAFSTTRAASRLAMDRGVAAIAVFTMSGRTARLMSKARPPAPILAFTASQATHRQMGLLWGVEPRLCDYADSVEAMIQTVERDLLDSGRVARGQQVVIVASLPVGARGAPNFTYLHTLS